MCSSAVSAQSAAEQLSTTPTLEAWDGALTAQPGGGVGCCASIGQEKKGGEGQV